MKVQHRLKLAQCLTGSATIVCVIELGISFLCFSNLPQVSLTRDDEHFEYGMRNSIELPTGYDESSYSCLSQLDSFERIGDALAAARSAFVVGELIADATLVVALIRLSCMLSHGHVVVPLALWVLGTIQAIGRVLATLLFVLVSDVDFLRDCDSLCAELTVYLMCFNTICSMAFLGCLVAIQKLRPPIPAEPVSRLTLPEVLVAQLVVGLAVSFSLHCGAFLATWVNYEYSGIQKGGLLIAESIGGVEEVEYSCLCFDPSASAETRVCEAAAHLVDAGLEYLNLASISLMFFIVWTEQLICTALGFSTLHLSIRHAVPWIAVLFHSAALLFWFEKSEASLSSHCVLTADDSSIPLCATTGPILSICSLCLLVLSAVLSNFIFQHSSKPRQKQNLDLTNDLEARDKTDYRDMQHNRKKISKTRSLRVVTPELIFDGTLADATDNASGEYCLSCWRLLKNEDLTVSECGHILHTRCSKRIDNKALCRLCSGS